jgi:hypothetical protein
MSHSQMDFAINVAEYLSPQDHGDGLGNEYADNLSGVGRIHSLQPVAWFDVAQRCGDRDRLVFQSIRFDWFAHQEIRYFHAAALWAN